MSVWFFFSSRRRHTRCAISDWSSDVCSSDLRCTGLFGEADFLPRRALGQQRAHQLVVECVAGLVALEGADDGVAGQVQVADRVEDLVAHELVAVAQAVVVEHAELGQDDRSEEHKTELQSLMRITFAVFCLKTKKLFILK